MTAERKVPGTDSGAFSAALSSRYGFSWGWPKALGGTSASWGIWFVRDAEPWLDWRLNIGPLHVVRLSDWAMRRV